MGEVCTWWLCVSTAKHALLQGSCCARRSPQEQLVGVGALRARKTIAANTRPFEGCFDCGSAEAFPQELDEAVVHNAQHSAPLMRAQRSHMTAVTWRIACMRCSDESGSKAAGCRSGFFMCGTTLSSSWVHHPRLSAIDCQRRYIFTSWVLTSSWQLACQENCITNPHQVVSLGCLLSCALALYTSVRIWSYGASSNSARGQDHHPGRPRLPLRVCMRSLRCCAGTDAAARQLQARGGSGTAKKALVPPPVTRTYSQDIVRQPDVKVRMGWRSQH